MIAPEFNVSKFEKRRRTLRDAYSSSYRQVHREIADHLRPMRGLATEPSDREKQGQKRHQKVINSTPLQASKNAQSGLQAGVTSPSRPWKKLGPSVSNIEQIQGAKEFFAETDRRMDFVFAKSNLYQATHTAYADFVDHGVGCIQVDSHDTEILRCIVHPVGSWVGAVDGDGRVNVFYRDYKVTGHELMSRFGDDVPKALQDQIKLDPYKRHDLYNAIEPNPFFVEGRPAIGLAAFPFLSVWWVKGQEKKFLKVHGYYEFPVLVFRFNRTDNGDVYGFGPGWDALGEAKQLQHQEDKKLRAIDKMVEPPLQAPTALRMSGVSLISGHVNYHDGPAKVESLYNINLPIQYLLQDIAEIERRINEIYFKDLFRMISETVNRQVTAREIEERHQEKLLMLGPVLESISDELLDPLIDRTVGIMRRAGLIPEAPPELDGVEIKVEYISILAQAQRAAQTASIEQGIAFVGGVAQLVPEVLDRINPDGVADAYFERIGFPPEATRTVKEAALVRQQRADQAQQDRQLELAGGAAQVAKDASQAQVGDSNVLTSILQGATAA